MQVDIPAASATSPTVQIATERPGLNENSIFDTSGISAAAERKPRVMAEGMTEEEWMEIEMDPDADMEDGEE